MSTWCGLNRSNYFKVKDPAAFKAFVAQFSVLTFVYERQRRRPALRLLQ